MFNDISQALCFAAKEFHRRGWMLGTAGNLSAKTDDDIMWLTASGKSKGLLSPEDLIQVEISTGRVLLQNKKGNKPSAETSIHQTIYSAFPEAKACFHVHSVDAYIATRKYATNNYIALPNIEMIKGFDIWKQTPNVKLPVFDNHLDVSQISRDIAEQFSQHKPDLDALMIRDHGITVWGNSVEQTYNRVEILEFIMSFLARQT